MPKGLLDDIRVLIEQAHQRVAATVNSELTILYWQIGKRIRQDVVREDKHEGVVEQIVQTVSALLTEEYGKGFSRRNLFTKPRIMNVTRWYLWITAAGMSYVNPTSQTWVYQGVAFT
jgi:hypothetical protein